MTLLATIHRWTVSRLSSRRAAAKRDRRRIAWQIEELEGRLLLTAYTPAQISQAYNVNQIMFGTVKGDGTGQTIAIVNAYHAPNVQSDLSKFNAAFGLPNTDGTGAPVLTVATPQGIPAYNKVWAQESTLDVQWAHAIAPGAHILLVEAYSSNIDDLMLAVNYARNQPGVSVVSMSWGATEFLGQTNYDTYLTTPSGHQGVSFVASAGDFGAVVQYPAISPNVLSVGGTTLATSSTAGTYGTETAWSGSGGGISAYVSKPSYQSGVSLSSTKRSGPDVSYVADKNTGVQVYFTDAATGSSGWWVFGGTSIGAPQWAAIVAIANQGRALAGQGTLDGKSQLLPAIYNMASTNFHDVTSGSTTNGTVTYTASAGYDLITGRGSPYANLVVSDLLKVAGTTTSGGTTSGGTTSGGTTSGGTKGGKRPRSAAQHAFDAVPHFAVGDEADILIGAAGNGVGARSLSTPSQSDLASRFGTSYVSPYSRSLWDQPAMENEVALNLSGSHATIGAAAGAGDHANPSSGYEASGWSRSADQGWSWNRESRRSSALDSWSGENEAATPELVDAFFVSLAEGGTSLPELVAA